MKALNFLNRLYKLFAYLLVSQLLSRKQVFVVSGLRRSGNHGFINWFSNALLKDNVEFEKFSKAVVNISQDRKLILFNEVNYGGGIPKFIYHLINQGTKIKEAKYIIISLEDYTPQDKDPYIPRNAQKILIKRSILNLIASRIQRATNQAKIGLDRGDMSIDDDFIAHYRWIVEGRDEDWTTWDYDQWMLDDGGYRKTFLASYGLEEDIAPAVSHQGGGSSFTGREGVPTTEDTLNRLQMIEWPERILELLSRKENTQLLDEEERAFVLSEGKKNG